MADVRVKALISIRDKLTAELAESSGRDSSTIAHELRSTLAEIERLAPPRRSSRIDELASRRAGRLPTAKGRQRAEGDQSGTGQ